MADIDKTNAIRASGSGATVTAAPAATSTTQGDTDTSLNLNFFQDTTPDVSGGTSKAYVPQNTNYWVRIFQKTTNYDVIANAPAEFEFQYANEWADVMSVWGGGQGAGGKLGNLLKKFGSYTQSRISTIQIWTGTRPLEFTIPLVFKANADPVKEVVEPVRKLFQMASPGAGVGRAEGSIGNSIAKTITGAIEGVSGYNISTAVQGAFLRAPGPNVVESIAALTSGHFMPNYAIFLRIGRRVTYPGLVITQISGKWGNRFTSEGYPISAEVTVGFRTFTTWSRNEISNALFSGQPFDYGQGAR